MKIYKRSSFLFFLDSENVLFFFFCIAVCTEKCEIVVDADPESSGPFKEKMDAFFRVARAELANEQEALLDAKSKFKAVMQFYQYTPKGAKNLDAADPSAFFILWLGFCQDFKVYIVRHTLFPRISLYSYNGFRRISGKRSNNE